MAAMRGDPRAIDLGTFMTNYKDCNFSFSGLKNAIRTYILKSERKHGKAFFYLLNRIMININNIYIYFFSFNF